MAAKRKTKTTESIEPAITAPAQATGPDGYFARISSNVKGGVALPLSPCTAIVSHRNRAGKTAVLDSVRLALTGQHPIGPHAADLAGLCRDGELPRATLTGAQASAEFFFPEGKRTPEHDVSGALEALTPGQLANLLPLSSLGDLLRLGASKAREELFRRFGGTVVSLTPPDVLDDAQKALWTAALTSSEGDAVARLTQAGTYLRSEKRAVSAQLKSLDDEKDRLAGATGDGVVVTDDMVQRAEAELDAIRAWEQAQALRLKRDAQALLLDEAITTFQALVAPDSREQFDSWWKLHIDSSLTHLRAEGDRAKAAVAQAERQLDVLKQVVAARKASIEAEQCVCCAAEANPQAMRHLLATGEDLLQKASQRLLGDAQGKLDTLRREYVARQQQLNQEREEALRTWEYAATMYRAAASDVKVLSAEVAQLDSLLKSIGAAQAPARVRAVVEEDLARFRAALGGKDGFARINASLRSLQSRQSDIKAVEVVVDQALARLVKSVKDTAETAVNAWLPQGFKAVLALEDTDGKPTCRWEVVGTDGRPHPRGAASGAEWSALAVAIACAWTEGAPIRVLLLDDTDIAGFSADNVRSLLGMVAKAVSEGRLTQALVAWSRPEEVPADGWTVVGL